MKRLIKFFVLTALLCLSAACTQTFESFENTNNQKTQKAQGKIVMSVGGESRTITPTISASSIKFAVLSANGKEIKTWDNSNHSEDFITQIENDDEIILDVGTYEFELVFFTQLDEIVQCGKCTHEVTSGINKITFNMQYAYFGNGNTFVVWMVTVNWDEKINVDKVIAGLYDIETREPIKYEDEDGKTVTCEETKTISTEFTKSYHSYNSGMPAGQYLFKCELYYKDRLVNTVIDVVKFIDGIFMWESINVDKLNGFYAVTYQTDGTWNKEPTELRLATVGVTLPTAADITNGDCEFQGWYDDAGNKMTEIPAGTITDTTVIGRWEMTCTADELCGRLKKIKEGIYDIVVTGTMTESIITSINDSLYDDGYEDGKSIKVNRKKLKVNLDLSQTTGLTSIPNRAFGKYQDNGNLDVGLTSLTGIVLPENITTIKGYAFSGCTSLKSITIPPSVTSIEKGAFRLHYNSYGTGDDIYVERVYISDLAAWCNIKMYEQYDNGYIEEQFANPLRNADLYLDGDLVEELVIPDGVTSINNFAFIRCKSIKKVVIPASVTSIGKNVFYGCKNLESITFENTENWWMNVISPYNGKGGLIEADFTNPEQNADYLKNNEHFQLYTVPDSGIIEATKNNVVSKLSVLAADNTYVIKLTGNITADTISSIVPYLQDETKKIKLDLSGSTGLTSIPHRAFFKCKSLVIINLPNGIKEIESHAFESCSYLIRVNIPDGVTNIGHCAFYGCNSLSSLTMPDSVTSLGKELQNSECEYYLDSRICKTCGKDIYDCNHNQQALVCQGKRLALFTGNTQLKSVEFSKNLTYIPEDTSAMFYNCANLTSIILPEGMTSIKGNMFFQCTNLKSITIPNSVTYIGKNAFYECTSLESVTIPDSVTYIGEEAFEDCSSLTSVAFPDNGIYIGLNAFTSCTNLESVTIPANVNLERGTFSECSNLKNVILADGFTTIARGMFVNCTGLTNITIPDSVTSIGDAAFFECKSLESIIIPDGVTSIADSTFDGCQKLKKVTIPASVTSIGKRAFYNCYRLTSVIIPDGVTSISDSTFECCFNLNSVTIPDSVTSIGKKAFYYCKFESVDIPDSVTSIGEMAFANCLHLTSISIPPNVTFIPRNTFESCSMLTGNNEYDNASYLGNESNPYLVLLRAKNTNITSCEINASTKAITSYAFSSCKSLTSVTISDSVTEIGRNAFWWCEKLTSVTIPASVTYIDKDAFYECGSLTSVTFKNTNNWYRGDAYGELQIQDVTDPEMNAMKMEAGYYWIVK